MPSAHSKVMKLELKSENENYSKLFSTVFKTLSSLAVIFFLCDLSLKLGIISRNYKIDYICRLLAVEKSSINFKKLSKISNLKNKQKIWEFCREFVK